MLKETTESFGQGERPEPNGIVIRDGFDEIEKEDSVVFYACKSWQEVLAHLREQQAAAYFLEEWSVLSPEALAYYLRGHLEYLSETLTSTHPDEEYVFQFFGALYQVIFIHKGSPFSVHQTDLLKRLAEDTSLRATDEKKFPFYSHDIANAAAQFLSELAQHEK